MSSRFAVRGFAALLAALPPLLAGAEGAFAQYAFAQYTLAQYQVDEGAVASFASRFDALNDATPMLMESPRSAGPARSDRQPQSEPFGLEAKPVTTGEVRNKWAGLVADITADTGVLTRCRDDATDCPSAARKFLDLIADGRAHQGLARIGLINRAINLAIQPESDLAQWGVPDRWSAPLATLTSGRGDCEDYAIAKYVALREAGLEADDIRLVIVRDLASDSDHAVAAVRFDGAWIVLDNRRLTLLEDSDMAHVVPLFVIDQTGVRRYIERMPPTAQARHTPAGAASTTPSALGL